MKKQITTGALTFVAALLAITGLPARAHAVFPGVNGRLVYVDHDGGNYDIFSAKSDGTDIVNLTNAASNTQDDPAYSADGTKIVYAAYDGAWYDIVVMNADGTNKNTIVNTAGYNTYPTFSPDGTKIIFASTMDASDYEIYTVNVDGTGLTRLTNSGTAFIQPEYSPDGTKIVMRDEDMANTDIYVMDADGSNITNITNNSNAERDPSWSPDGSKIVFARHGSSTFDIATIESDGTDLTILTNNGAIEVDPTFSPDGNYIAYRYLPTEMIRIMNADGTNAHDAIDGTAFRSLNWQPLTIAPTAASSTQTLTLSGGTGTIDIPALYTDAYGEGVDSSSVTITANPTLGTASVNSSTGVITYTQNTVAAGSFWNSLASVFFPRASAQAADSFSYQVCSNASASLCATGTVSVLGLSVLAETGNNRSPLVMLIAVWLIGSACAVFMVRKRSATS